MTRKIICIGIIGLFLLTMFASIGIVGKNIKEEKTISDNSNEFKIEGPRVTQKVYRNIILVGKVWYGTDRIELTINWGDGDTTYDDNSNQGPGKLEFVHGHEYSNFRKYTITCIAEDVATGNTVTKTVEVNCADRGKSSVFPGLQLISARLPVLKNLLSLINQFIE